MNETCHAPPRVPAWSSPVEALRLIARGYTFHTCIRVAVVVGTVLSIVNQGTVVVAGDATTMTAARVGVNYLGPFVADSDHAGNNVRYADDSSDVHRSIRESMETDATTRHPCTNRSRGSAG